MKDGVTPRLSFPGLLAAWLAVFALWLSSGGWLPAIFAVALLAAYISNTRLDGDGAALRLLRYAAFAVVIYMAYERLTSLLGGDSFEMIFAQTIGQLCAIELVIQCWLQKPIGGPRVPSSALLSVMIMLAASNTFDWRFIPFLTPLFFMMLALSFRAFGTVNSEFNWRRTVALVAVLLFAAVTHGGVFAFRNQISQFSMRFLEGRTVQTGGLSTEPRLGSRFNNLNSVTRMLRLTGPLPESGYLYLRAAAYLDYSQDSWLPEAATRSLQPVSAAQLRAKSTSGNLIAVERLVDDQSLVFAPLNTAEVSAPLGTFSMDWQLGPLRLETEDSGTALYEMIVPADEQYQGLLCQPPDAAWKQRYLKVPAEIDPRVRALAQRIGHGAQTDLERVQRVERYLIQNHRYSLEARFGEGDKISQFLLEKRSAHCEYFASSAVILLRCLGVPARYVVGYLGHEADGANAMVVRGRDAHAWTEYRLNGKWLTLDATPGGGRPDELAQGLPLGVKLRESVAKIAAAGRDFVERLRNLPVTFWLAIFASLTAFLIWRITATRTRRDRTEAFRYAARDADLSLLARRFERWLTRQGAPCPPGVTWREHIRRLRLEQAQGFVESYEQARFGRNVGALGELKNKLHSLEKTEIKKDNP